MTFEEARKLAAIAANVDSGCPSCVGGVCAELNEAFPDFIWELPKDHGEVFARPASEAESEESLNLRRQQDAKYAEIRTKNEAMKLYVQPSKSVQP